MFGGKEVKHDPPETFRLQVGISVTSDRGGYLNFNKTYVVPRELSVIELGTLLEKVGTLIEKEGN